MNWQQVGKAKRLLERERGTIYKDWGGKLPIALIFPNSYRVGMSNLAVHTLYRLWNARDDVVCERVFTDSTPPHSLESAAPLNYFPVIAFSVSYELDYFSVVGMLKSAGIPPMANERDDTQPLVLAGGPAVSANPEPLALVVDSVVIGEVEPIITPLTEALLHTAESRDAALQALVELPGVYVPQMHTHDLDPRQLDERYTIRRLWLRNLDSSPTHSVILTPKTEFADMGLIEIARGCGRGCRFCLAGYAYRPPRERSVSTILDQARDLMRDTNRLGLVSAAVSDHTHIDEMARQLRALGARLSVSSMRVDPVSEPLIGALAESGAQTLTIAPEAGSERLRRVINKTQTEDDVLRAVELAASHGFRQVKLYFMLGLPTEEQPDIEALVDLVVACSERFRRQLTVNITPFVPKAHTPFERLAQAPAKVVTRRIDYVKKQLRPMGVSVKAESPAWAEIQGALARGDRRIAEALIRVERPTLGVWRSSLAEAGLFASEFLRERGSDELLPWDLVQTGVKPDYLRAEALRAGAARISAACPPDGCATCGACLES
jgi:radical SAM superfamily enzyme YgiQ (UPF0313 family)